MNNLKEIGEIKMFLMDHKATVRSILDQVSLRVEQHVEGMEEAFHEQQCDYLSSEIAAIKEKMNAVNPERVEVLAIFLSSKQVIGGLVREVLGLPFNHIDFLPFEDWCKTQPEARNSCEHELNWMQHKSDMEKIVQSDLERRETEARQKLAEYRSRIQEAEQQQVSPTMLMLAKEPSQEKVIGTNAETNCSLRLSA